MNRSFLLYLTTGLYVLTSLVPLFLGNINHDSVKTILPLLESAHLIWLPSLLFLVSSRITRYEQSLSVIAPLLITTIFFYLLEWFLPISTKTPNNFPQTPFFFILLLTSLILLLTISLEDRIEEKAWVTLLGILPIMYLGAVLLKIPVLLTLLATLIPLIYYIGERILPHFLDLNGRIITHTLPSILMAGSLFFLEAPLSLIGIALPILDNTEDDVEYNPHAPLGAYITTSLVIILISFLTKK